MKRREFLSLTAAALAGSSLTNNWPAFAAETKIADKDILKDGMPAPIANFCETPDKQPNKFCPDWKAKPGHCKDCMFYNQDKSETTHKGKKFAKCSLLSDPKKPQFVSENAYCATFVKRP